MQRTKPPSATILTKPLCYESEREGGSIDRHIDMVFYVCPYRIFFFSDIRYYWIYAEKALYCVCVCVCVCVCMYTRIKRDTYDSIILFWYCLGLEWVCLHSKSFSVWKTKQRDWNVHRYLAFIWTNTCVYMQRETKRESIFYKRIHSNVSHGGLFANGFFFPDFFNKQHSNISFLIFKSFFVQKKRKILILNILMFNSFFVQIQSFSVLQFKSSCVWYGGHFLENKEFL